ncbi:hypothetical protein PQR09_41645 [Paraburkholderia sediminicola]|uniref:hypothetical protein n=1 Tax=Paraburkholderia sediminicola TaxID=458836 RepID=UPI0038B889DF
MSRLKSLDGLFAGRHFDRDVIILCVRWYLRYKLNDAQWLQQLHACGLLRASFRPGGDIAELRAYLRSREMHTDFAAAHIQHMQKALTFMNIQLHHVIADITGVTGMRIVRAIVAGEREPDRLAAMRDVHCKESLETIRDALVGNYQPEHVFALSKRLRSTTFISSALTSAMLRSNVLLRFSISLTRFRKHRCRRRSIAARCPAIPTLMCARPCTNWR